MKATFMAISLALAVSGCASAPSTRSSSARDPSNPNAPEAVTPAATAVLTADADLSGASAPKGVMVAPATEPQPGPDMMMGNDSMTVMGAMAGGAMAQSAMPGVPGVSHLYHMGATGFFLDHQEHIQLSADQQKKLNQIRENALLDKATADRNVEEAEQQLWKLTAAAEPDLAQIEAQVREIEKLRGDQRLTLVRPVAEAAKVLTEEQTKILLGTAAPVTPDMPAAKPATPGSNPTEKPAAKPEHKH